MTSNVCVHFVVAPVGPVDLLSHSFSDRQTTSSRVVLAMSALRATHVGKHDVHVLVNDVASHSPRHRRTSFDTTDKMS